MKKPHSLKKRSLVYRHRCQGLTVASSGFSQIMLGQATMHMRQNSRIGSGSMHTWRLSVPLTIDGLQFVQDVDSVARAWVGRCVVAGGRLHTPSTRFGT